MRIAIIGSGISGLVCAHLLHPAHRITLFEAAGHVGGHTHTVAARQGERSYQVDTGFVVFNHRTYPNFTRLLERLGVASKPADMSFGVRCDRSGVEYCGSSLNTLFAQRRNLLRPAFHRMIRDILRFNREARRLLRRGLEAMTLRQMLAQGGYSSALMDHYVVPMGGAIWSGRPQAMLDFPASFFVRFFENHGLLGARSHLSWRVIEGGSQRYVEAMIRPFRDRIRLRTPVRAIRRLEDGVEVRPAAGAAKRFDQVIVATHSDQALALLEDPSPAEREILQAFPYQPNDAVLHTDASVMPRRQRAWASWNYRVPPRPARRVEVTYNMSRLQGLDSPAPFLLSLNQEHQVDPARAQRRLSFSHPLYLPASLEAQRRHAEISGVRRTHYCGAYWGNGFHEDGVNSGLAVCRAFGVDPS